MTISALELLEKRDIIQSGLEFRIHNYNKTRTNLLRVLQVSTINKTSCWGEYQEDRVWYDLIFPETQRSYAPAKNEDGTIIKRKDGSEIMLETWAPIPGKFKTERNSLRLDCFIEYKFNKRIQH